MASYAIAWSVAFLVFGPTLSMTQASIAWHSSPDLRVRERGPRLIIALGFCLGALMALATFTPFAYWLFTTLLHTQPQTAAIAVDVARCQITLGL